jgi:hypothetical protein
MRRKGEKKRKMILTTTRDGWALRCGQIGHSKEDPAEGG